MATKRDIESREDLTVMLKSFYAKVIKDETIGIIFTEVVPLDWDKHIPLITDFWETILLDNPVYKSNAMEPHFHINRLFPLHEKHFSAWLKLFNETIDKLYEGPIASLAKKRAEGIAKLMLLKMTAENEGKNGSSQININP